MDLMRDKDIDLEATELRLGLPGTSEKSKRRLVDGSTNGNSKRQRDEDDDRFECSAPPPSKAQIVGWPPVRSNRKNIVQQKRRDHRNGESASGVYVKVSMDGAPYLRKIDLSFCSGYKQLLRSLENMFRLTIGEYSEREGYGESEFAPTYEDKDGDWMLVGDVPWEMFASSCKRLRIMRGSEARGLTTSCL